MYNKTITRFGFCDIQNNQGLGKGYQPQPSALSPYLHLDFLDITTTESNNCLKCDNCFIWSPLIVFNWMNVKHTQRNITL